MAMKNIKRGMKIAAACGLCAAIAFGTTACVVRPDPVDGGGADANPTLLVFKTATPIPTALPDSSQTGQSIFPADGQITSPPAIGPGTLATGSVIAQPTTPPSAMVTFSIGGTTPVDGGSLPIGSVQTPAATPTPTPRPSLRTGDTGDRVRDLQQRLKNLGYYTGSVDGHFGEGTYDAVKAFQRRNGLSADGIAGKATLELLQSGNAKRAATPSPAPTSSALRVGSTGSRVRSMQQRLKDLGYYTGSVDGTFGAGTESALKAFQRANGLSADGVAGSATLSKLNSSSAKSASSASSRATARPAMRTYVPSTLSSYRYLQQGSSGSDVKKLQQRLKDLGYFSGSVNGSFGADTEVALREFQDRNGLWVDGVAGEDTQRMLYSSEALGARR